MARKGTLLVLWTRGIEGRYREFIGLREDGAVVRRFDIFRNGKYVTGRWNATGFKRLPKRGFTAALEERKTFIETSAVERGYIKA